MTNQLTIHLWDNDNGYVPYTLETEEGLTYEGHVYSVTDAENLRKLWDAELHFEQYDIRVY